MVVEYADPSLDVAVDLNRMQNEIYYDDNRFIVAIAGRGVGKGWSICSRLIKMIDDGTVLDGALIIVLAPTYPQLKIGAVRTFDKLLGAAGMIVEKINGNEPERRLIRGITVVFRNASNPDQTRGGETQFVWLDEAAQMDDGVLSLTNMNNRQFGEFQHDGTPVLYQTFITTTPRGRNWIWRDFFDPNTKKWGPEIASTYHMTTEEAIAAGTAKSSYISESGYPEGSEMYRQEILGEFSNWAGLVFDRFDRVKHCPDPFILPKFKTVTGGIDVGYGGRGFTSIHLSGVTEAGAIYTFREYHEKRANTHEWMRVCGEWTKEYNVNSWYIDAAADSELRAMKSAGLRAFPSVKVKDAAGVVVNFLNSKFQRNELFIDRIACPFLVSEIEAYKYKEIVDGLDTTFLMKVVPNQHEDAIDSWRYGAYPLSSAAAALTYGATIPISFGG